MLYNFTRLDNGRLTLRLRSDQRRGYRASALDRDDYGGRMRTNQRRARYWGMVQGVREEEGTARATYHR